MVISTFKRNHHMRNLAFGIPLLAFALSGGSACAVQQGADIVPVNPSSGVSDGGQSFLALASEQVAARQPNSRVRARACDQAGEARRSVQPSGPGLQGHVIRRRHAAATSAKATNSPVRAIRRRHVAATQLVVPGTARCPVDPACNGTAIHRGRQNQPDRSCSRRARRTTETG